MGAAYRVLGAAVTMMGAAPMMGASNRVMGTAATGRRGLGLVVGPRPQLKIHVRENTNANANKNLCAVTSVFRGSSIALTGASGPGGA